MLVTGHNLHINLCNLPEMTQVWEIFWYLYAIDRVLLVELFPNAEYRVSIGRPCSTLNMVIIYAKTEIADTETAIE